MENTVKTANMSSIMLILVSVLLSSIGQLTFKAALNDIGELTISISMFIDMLLSPLMLLGIAIYGASAFLWLLALMKAELSFAYPFLSVTYGVVLLGGALLFDETITAGRIAGVILIVMGLIVIARSEQS